MKKEDHTYSLRSKLYG